MIADLIRAQLVALLFLLHRASPTVCGRAVFIAYYVIIRMLFLKNNTGFADI